MVYRRYSRFAGALQALPTSNGLRFKQGEIVRWHMEKDFDTWNEEKKKLHAHVFADFVHMREVWWCAVGVNVGVEADGKHDNFERPVLVLQKFSKDAVLAVCITSRVRKDNSYHVVYAHDGKEFSAVISQIRLVSTKRLIRKIFSMDSANFRRIRDAVAEMINKRPPLSRGPRRAHAH